jgi:hypothetical protein
MWHAMSVFCLAGSTARAHKKALFGNKGSRAIEGARSGPWRLAKQNATDGTPGKPGFWREAPKMRPNSELQMGF